jgi:phage terminase large subunit
MSIYIKEIYFSNNTSTAKLMRIIHERIGTVGLIIADSAQRRQIKDYYHGMHGDDGKFYSGVNIRKVRKSKGVKMNFKQRKIKRLQGFKLVITPDSPNVIKAVKNYRWHDSRAGVPNHDWSDLCDSWGYAAIDYIDSYS